MKFDPLRHHRHSIRLKGYDYARAGAYFVTMCAWHREMIFGEVVEGEMRLSEAGQSVCDVWEGLPTHYAHVELDAFVVMPNHVHGIIVLVDDEVGADVRTGRIGAGLRPAPTPTAPTTTTPTTTAPTTTAPTTTTPTSRRHGLPEIVRALKSFSARGINEFRATPGVPVWQRNYYEHIIRNERALNAIRQYIANNPLKWSLDRDNPTQRRAEANTVEDYLNEVSV